MNIENLEWEERKSMIFVKIIVKKEGVLKFGLMRWSKDFLSLKRRWFFLRGSVWFGWLNCTRKRKKKMIELHKRKEEEEWFFVKKIDFLSSHVEEIIWLDCTMGRVLEWGFYSCVVCLIWSHDSNTTRITSIATMDTSANVIWILMWSVHPACKLIVGAHHAQRENSEWLVILIVTFMMKKWD